MKTIISILSVVSVFLAHSPARETLSSNRVYYVSTNGNDASDGLSSSTALFTLQAAADKCHSIDFAGHSVTIQVADGSYTSGVVLPSVMDGSAYMIGNISSPSSVTISCHTDIPNPLPQGGYGIYGETPVKLATRAVWSIAGFRLTTSGQEASCLMLRENAVANFSAVDFGPCTRFHIEARELGLVRCVGDYVISGGAVYHAAIHNGSYYEMASRITGPVTVTLVNQPAFSVFLYTWRNGGILVDASKSTFVGSATGIRFRCGANGVIHTAGGGVEWLPGDRDGWCDSGGQYVIN